MVGTFKDVLIEKLGKEGADKKIAKLDEEILSLVKEHKYDDLVLMANQGKKRVMFTVDNTSRHDHVFPMIRSRIKEWIYSREEFRINFPLSYLLASLKLQNYKDAFVDLKEFASSVEEYGIEDSDMKHLLQFLHSRIGQIRYFHAKGIEGVIVREPQCLFNFVADLIIDSFLSETSTVKQYSDLQKGIYSADYFDTIKSKLQSKILTLEMVLLLLEELRIVAPFHDHRSDSEKYFIPCVLNHLENTFTSNPESLVQSLALRFECGHCPKGMFGVLIHYLVTHKDKNAEWRLDVDKIFRNQVSFEVGPFSDLMTIRFHTTHLDISCHSAEHKESPSLKTICSTVRSTLELGLEQATISLHYDKEKTRHILGFICKKQSCEKFHEIKKVESRRVIICSGEHTFLTESGLYWFGSKCMHVRTRGSLDHVMIHDNNNYAYLT